MAHAINGYAGACKNIHGHSYELHVTVSGKHADDTFIPAPGMLIDFKEIKKIVQQEVVEKFDHKVLLSHKFLVGNPAFLSPENLVTWQVEPTAENMLLYISSVIKPQLPKGISLVNLKLFETKDSYAEWISEGIHHN